MGVTFVDIDDENDVGQRIDNFLMRRLKGVPKQKIYSILRKGEVRVNSGRVKQTYRLKTADRVRIPPVSSRAEAPVQLNDETQQILEASILFEDKDFIAINKPYGFAVHGGSSITSGVVEMLRVLRNLPRIELAHRLDRDTSGCLLLCKKRGVLKEVQAAFRERTVKKKYTLIAQGPWPGKVRAVRDRLLRYETDWGERRVRVDAKGQVARTDFQILEQAGACNTTAGDITYRAHPPNKGACSISRASDLGRHQIRRQQVQQRKSNACAYTLPDWSCPWVMTDWTLSAPLEPTMVKIWAELKS